MPLALMRNFEAPQDATDYYLMSGDLRVGRIYERQGTQGLEFLWALTTVFFRETLRTIRLRHLADCVCRTATAAPSASVLNRGAQCRFHCDFGPSWPLNGMERNAPFFVKTLSDEWNRNTRQFVP
jgi:hypothetical protein